jgi:hypothetical protein
VKLLPTRVANPYSALGITLIVTGVLFALIAWAILGYNPLIALGLGGVILGIVAIMLGGSLPPVSPEASLSFLEAGSDNIAALVEELVLRGRAVYLPSSLSPGRLRTLIPFKEDVAELALHRPLGQRLIVHFGQDRSAFGILIATPGSSVLEHQEVLAGAGLDELDGILSTILVGHLALASAVHVLGDGQSIVVDVGRPALSSNEHATTQILGSPLASIIATVAAEVLGQPVRIESERHERHRHVVEIRTLGSE